MPDDIDEDDIAPQSDEKLSTVPHPLPQGLVSLTHHGNPRHLAHGPGPLGPDAKGLLAPGAERDLFHHGGGGDFFAFETAPRDGVDGGGALAGEEVVRGRGGVEGYFPLGVEVVEAGFEGAVEGAGGDEEFDKGFLEDEAAGRAPAVGWVGGGQAVDRGLGGDGPVAFLFRQGGELVLDECGFGGDCGGFGPG